MSLFSNPLLIILVAILLAVIVNLVLVATVQTNARRTDGGVINRMLKSVREPFKETDQDLDELARLLEISDKTGKQNERISTQEDSEH